MNKLSPSSFPELLRKNPDSAFLKKFKILPFALPFVFTVEGLPAFRAFVRGTVWDLPSIGTGELAIAEWVTDDFRVRDPLEEDGGVGGRPVDGVRCLAVIETASCRGLRNMSYAAMT